MKLSRAWLTERVTLEQILAEHDFASSAVEFKSDWERLLAKKIAGDELWCFAPPPGQIEITGIALVRDGEIISTLVEAVY